MSGGRQTQHTWVLLGGKENLSGSSLPWSRPPLAESQGFPCGHLQLMSPGPLLNMAILQNLLAAPAWGCEASNPIPEVPRASIPGHVSGIFPACIGEGSQTGMRLLETRRLSGV